MRNIKFNIFGRAAIKNKLLFIVLLLTGISATVFSQSADVFPVPDNYKTEGIPAIKNSEVEHLFYDPSLIRSNLIWDADRQNRRLLVTDQTNNVYLLNSALEQPVKLIEKVIPQSVKINPNGESFSYTSDHEDEDNYQLYLYDFKTKTSKKLITLTGKDESIESVVWNEKGAALYYLRIDYDQKISKLCTYDFKAEKCFDAEMKGVWNVFDVKKNRVLLKYWKASTSQLLYYYDLQTNKLVPVDEKGNSRKAFFVGDTVFWTSEGNENCRQDPCILTYNLKNNKTEQLALPKDILTASELRASPEGKNLMIQETKNGIDRLRVFQLKKDKLGKEYPAFISGSFVIWNTRWMSDEEILYTLENNSKPASIQSYNLETKTVTNWTKERLPAQLENKVNAPEMFSWKSFDQRDISGYLIRPKTANKKTPVLIFMHGGPQVLDRPLFSSQDIRFASNLGLTIIHTNIRGSSGFGKDYMDADNREKRGDAVKDIQALLDWIEKQPDLDASKIFLRGESYGGFIALSTALQEPKRIKGVIAEYPLISIRNYLAQSWIDEFAKTEYGDPKDEGLMSKLDEISPLLNTTRWNNIPVVLTVGKRDQRIPINDVIDLKTQLQNKGSEVWFICSNDSGHGFSSKYVLATLFTFLKKQINKEN